MFSAILFVGEKLQAQASLQLSQFATNAAWHNPAAIGLSEGLELNAVGRFQWVGLAGAPISQVFAADIPVPKLKSGWGMSLSNDMIGAARTTAVNFKYAYHLQLGKNSRLSVGAQAGLQQQRLNTNDLVTPSGEYLDGIQHNDVTIGEQSNLNAITPLLGAGVHYQLRNFEIGVSAVNLLGAQGTYIDSEVQNLAGSFLSTIVQYKWQITDEWQLNPAIHGKTNLSYSQLDANLSVSWRNFLEGGVIYRGYNNLSQDALVALLSVKPTPNLKILYSYDWNLSQLNTTNTGSHEFGIQYVVDVVKNQSKKVKKIYNPRFL